MQHGPRCLLGSDTRGNDRRNVDQVFAAQEIKTSGGRMMASITYQHLAELGTGHDALIVAAAMFTADDRTIPPSRVCSAGLAGSDCNGRTRGTPHPGQRSFTGRGSVTGAGSAPKQADAEEYTQSKSACRADFSRNSCICGSKRDRSASRSRRPSIGMSRRPCGLLTAVDSTARWCSLSQEVVDRESR